MPGGEGSARIFAPCVNAGGEQQRYRHWIKHGDKRQSDEPDRSLKIRGGYTGHLSKISHRSYLRLGAFALRFNLCLFDLEATERLGLTLTLGRDLSAFPPPLVSDRHRPDGTTEPRRFLDGGVDLGDAAIKVGDRPSLDRQASLDIGGPVGEGEIYGDHVVEVSPDQKPEHADRIQAHQHPNHCDKDQTQESRRRVPMLRQPRRRHQLPGLQHGSHDDDGPEGTGKDCGETVD